MNTNFIGLSKQNAYIEHGPVDAALMPVEHVTDLDNIEDKYRYEGMTVTVLKTADEQSIPIEYCIYNGAWKIKRISLLKTYAALKGSLPSDYRYYLVGLKAVVRKDETNDNKMTEYQVTNIDIRNKTVTWERCNGISSTASAITVEGADMESAEVL
ncbi:MAG: hypothetical protein UHU19_15285 [Lachnospiraceae bacterium]|nr:hypothetical protein [Lachnospiraceae bacterium]